MVIAALHDEPLGMAEVPRVERDDIIALIKTVMSETPPRVEYRNSADRLAIVLLGVLVTIGIALSGWTLDTVSNLKDSVAVIQCQLSSQCQHAIMGQQK